MRSWHDLSAPGGNRRPVTLRGLIAFLGLLAAMIVMRAFAGAQPPPPPPDLVALEKQVSLKIAHVRLQGPTNAADLKQLGEAQRVEMEGEKAMAAGDYKAAEQSFLRADVIINTIGD
jgi:hypothetical protein